MMTAVVAGMLALMLAGCAVAAGPEQIHLALTANAGEMLVAFAVTPAAPNATSMVRYWNAESPSKNRTVVGAAHTYTDGGFDGTLFEAVITGLVSSQTSRYMYTVFADGIESDIFEFTYNPGGSTVKFLSYGDMGVKNSYGTALLAAADAVNNNYDLVVNVGDTSYADDYPVNHNAKYFDMHFREIQGYAAKIPFMTCPGNHERQYNFAGYLNRLRMPTVSNGPLSRFYYSFNYGPVHFISYSSEHSFSQGSEQYNFIKADLSAASEPAARKLRPWIVMWSHRPLYCTDLAKWEGRCLTEANEYRDNIEGLMVAAAVDVHISGHNHQYERTWPVHGCAHNYASGCNITKSYHNAPSPVYIVNGAGGDIEGADPTWIADEAKVPFRAANDQGLHTGMLRVVANMTAMDLTFVYTGDRAIPGTNSSDLKDAGKVADHFILTKG